MTSGNAETERPRIDAICVLGVSTVEQTYKNRLDVALAIYNSNNSAKILLCGRFWGGFLADPAAPNENLELESVEMWRYLRNRGVRDQDLLIEPNSYNTLGNIINIREQFMLPLGWRSLVVITHREHLEKVRRITMKIIGDEASVQILDSGDNFTIYSASGTHARGDGRNIDFISMSELRNHPYYL